MSEFLMKNQIKVLDGITANQIAAGEVVERPCSVVKELVENAIDSGANKIDIKIKGAGVALISVCDNGCGLNPDDLIKCLLPHATSKISSINDLDSLTTLGFRGEALAAISSVSKLSIFSKPPQQEYAFQINCEGGKHELPHEVAAKDGTTVIVKDLFFNTPARKKFLKADSVETGYISDYLAHLAMSHPNISFSCINEGKTVLKTNGNGNLLETIIAIYGKNLSEELVPIEWIQQFMLNGFISKPTYLKANRNQYHFFVNGRWIQSKELIRCIDECYHTLIPQGRYPFILLSLQLAPSLLDVNVHPAKLEIKFKDFAPIEQVIKLAVTDTLYGKKTKDVSFGTQLPPMKYYYQSAVAAEQQDCSNEQSLLAKEAAFLDSNSLQKLLNGSQQNINFIHKHEPMMFMEQDIQQESTNSDEHNMINEKQKNNRQMNANYPQEAFTQYANVRDFNYSELTVLGQAAATYIIASGEQGLYITDQHAAHERLQYESFKKLSENHDNGSAPLLIPQNVELSHQEALLLTQYILQLSELGFIIEHFGNNTFVIRSVPLWYEGTAADLLLQNLLGEFQNGANPQKQDVLEEKLFMAACKSAVKANNYLSPAQIDSIFAGLDANPQALSCPHGRPITIKISYAELQKRFLRSGV